MKLAKAKDRWIYKAIHKIFVIDLHRDSKFYVRLLINLGVDSSIELS
jgi:hypothetical protein